MNFFVLFRILYLLKRGNIMKKKITWKHFVEVSTIDKNTLYLYESLHDTKGYHFLNEWTDLIENFLGEL